MSTDWKSMTAEQKYEALWAKFLSTEGKPFASPQVAELYRRRVQRLKDVCELKKPDSIPILLAVGNYVAEYAGISHGDMMYDYDKMAEAIIKFNVDFDLDYQAAGNGLPGKAFDRLGFRTYRWPGNGLPKHMPFQMVEDEYMLPDEYDQLIADPEGFFLRVYMPRIMKSLEGWKMFPSLYGVMELPMALILLGALTVPAVQEGFQAWIDAGRLAGEFFAAAGKAGAQLTFGYGMPNFLGGFTKAPFDIIGDTLRGTRGIMIDMYRQPDKVLATVERLVPIAIQMGIEAAMGAGLPLVFIPLHKGADGFMSTKDFNRFYWPTLKAVCEGLIEAGCVPFLFVEGGYNERLDALADSPLPAGKSMWMFDYTDLVEVKKKLGGWACFGGNVPVSLFYAGTPQQMADHVKKLIDTVGQDGGYFIAPGAVIDNARPENLHAFIQTAREYGKY